MGNVRVCSCRRVHSDADVRASAYVAQDQGSCSSCRSSHEKRNNVVLPSIKHTRKNSGGGSMVRMQLQHGFPVDMLGSFEFSRVFSREGWEVGLGLRQVW